MRITDDTCKALKTDDTDTAGHRILNIIIDTIYPFS